LLIWRNSLSNFNLLFNVLLSTSHSQIKIFLELHSNNQFLRLGVLI
jgi:hypothetical protein